MTTKLTTGKGIIQLTDFPDVVLFDNDKPLEKQSPSSRAWVQKAYDEGSHIAISWDERLVAYITRIEFKGKMVLVDKTKKQK